MGFGLIWESALKLLQVLSPFVPVLILLIKHFVPEKVSKNGREFKRVQKAKAKMIDRLQRFRGKTIAEIAEIGQKERSPRAEEGGLYE